MGALGFEPRTHGLRARSSVLPELHPQELSAPRRRADIELRQARRMVSRCEALASDLANARSSRRRADMEYSPWESNPQARRRQGLSLLRLPFSPEEQGRPEGRSCGVGRNRTADALRFRQPLFRLSYRTKVEPPGGFEPPTSWFDANHSVH